MLIGHRTEQSQKEYKKILGTTPPTVLLHRALLINSDLLPIYIHVFIALPVHRESMKGYIKKYWISLWTRQQDEEISEKEDLWQMPEYLLALTRVALHVPHPSDTAEVYTSNLLQKDTH
jgi:hypothetical protein